LSGPVGRTSSLLRGAVGTSDPHSSSTIRAQTQAKNSNDEEVFDGDGNQETVFKTVAFVRSATLPAGP
jgi:hypothetical protein